jgi:hypothetical protein
MDRRGVGGRKKIPGLFGRRVLAGFRRSGRSLDLVVAGFQAARVGASCADIAAELMHRSKQQLRSITSSARSFAETSTAIGLAVRFRSHAECRALLDI